MIYLLLICFNSVRNNERNKGGHSGYISAIELIGIVNLDNVKLKWFIMAI